MSELKITKERVLEAAATCEVAKNTLKKLFPECFNQSITEQVDGYKSACAVLRKVPLTENDFKIFGETAKMQFALEKITTIIKALNEGVLLDPLKKETRYYPYFEIKYNFGGSGLVFDGSCCIVGVAHSGSAARLGLKNRAISDFMGKNFTQEYAEFILI